MPIQSDAHPKAPESAARAISGVLFCLDKCAAIKCCKRDVSIARITSAAPSFAKWPNRPLIRCLSENG